MRRYAFMLSHYRHAAAAAIISPLPARFRHFDVCRCCAADAAFRYLRFDDAEASLFAAFMPLSPLISLADAFSRATCCCLPYYALHIERHAAMLPFARRVAAWRFDAALIFRADAAAMTPPDATRCHMLMLTR